MKFFSRGILFFKKLVNLIKIFIIILVFTACNSKHENYIFPEKAFPSLYIDVESNHVFADDKTFPDCIPKYSPFLINLKYDIWKCFNNKNKLSNFINNNFQLPEFYISKINPTGDIIDHIKQVMLVMSINIDKQPCNSSLIQLPYNFVIPGGRFREVYYWDTYFTLLGYADLHKNLIVDNMTENLAFLIKKFGHIPNGNRSYYLSRSQPPFFSYIVDLDAKLNGDSIYIKYLPELLLEYKYWMKNPHHSKVFEHSVILNNIDKLNHYYDNVNLPRTEMYNEDVSNFKLYKAKIKDTLNYFRNIRSTAESGWDFSSRWLLNDTSFENISTLDILPVDLNCLLYHLEKTIAKAYSLMNDNTALLYNEMANRRKYLINRLFWNNKNGFYFDYNFIQKEKSLDFTLAGVFPLFINIADSIQAVKVSNTIRKYFLKPGGVVTSLVNSGQQWDYPNGWAPLEWITIQALRNYHIYGLADTIRERWLHTNKIYFNRNHKMIEKYNVVDTTSIPNDGEYPAQDGFGWTNGVYIDLVNE